MEPTIAAQVKQLQGMTLAELRERWREVFGQETKQRHRVYLWKRLAWELQRQHFGGLSPEAEARLAELRREFETSPPETWFPGAQRRKAAQAAQDGPGARIASVRDPRLPPPGAVLTRRYKGRQIAVRVLERGFEYRGQRFRSLSAVAREVTGTGWNGFLFFGLLPGPPAEGRMGS